MGIAQRNELIRRRIKHANNRLKERQGIFLDDYEYYLLIDQIVSSQSIFVIRFSRNYTMHKVIYKSQWIPVIYSKRHKIILTVYQNNWVRKKPDGSYFIKPKKKPKHKSSKSNRVPWQLKNRKISSNRWV